MPPNPTEAARVIGQEVALEYHFEDGWAHVPQRLPVFDVSCGYVWLTRYVGFAPFAVDTGEMHEYAMSNAADRLRIAPDDLRQLRRDLGLDEGTAPK